jgi:hypothetical protein
MVVNVHNMSLPSFLPTVIHFRCLLGSDTCVTWLLCWWNTPKINIKTANTSDINEQKSNMILST